MAGTLAQAARPADPLHCRHCVARGRSPCGVSRLLGELRPGVTGHAVPRRIPSGTDIFRQGEAVAGAYTVLSGWVALCDTLPDGRSVILHFCLPGDVLPVELQGAQSARSASTVGDATVCSLSLAQHKRLLQTDRVYQDYYQAAVGRELHLAYDHFAEVVLASASERVASLLWELAVRSLRRAPLAGDRIQAPLSQIQIGLATGLTPVHVSRTLRRLREAGLIAFGDQTITVLDPSALRRQVPVSAETMSMWTARGA
jgi:CRP/FNR family transcriptional regulator